MYYVVSKYVTKKKFHEIQLTIFGSFLLFNNTLLYNMPQFSHVLIDVHFSPLIEFLWVNVFIFIVPEATLRLGLIKWLIWKFTMKWERYRGENIYYWTSSENSSWFLSTVMSGENITNWELGLTTQYTPNFGWTILVCHHW